MILASMLQIVLLIQLNILSLHAFLFECQKYCHESTVQAADLNYYTKIISASSGCQMRTCLCLWFAHYYW